jgi:hypothetical protein
MDVLKIMESKYRYNWLMCISLIELEFIEKNNKQIEFILSKMLNEYRKNISSRILKSSFGRILK